MAWETTWRVLDRLAPPRRHRPAGHPRRVPRHVRRRAGHHPGPPGQGRRRRPRQHAGRRGRHRRRRRRRPRRRRRARPAGPGRRPADRRPRAGGSPAWRAPTSGRRPSTASSSPPSRRRRRSLVTVPRGDLRATATRHESRWVADLVAAGSPFGPPTRRVVDSHAHGLAAHRVPGLGRRAPPPRAVDRRPRRRGRPRRRRSPATTTCCDGRSSCATPGPATASPSSTATCPAGRRSPSTGPSRRPASRPGPRCPHAYFVQLRARRPPDRRARVDRVAERRSTGGRRIHDAIDRLQTRRARRRPPRPGPDGLDRRARRGPAAGRRRRSATSSHDAGRTGRARVLGQRPRRSCWPSSTAGSAFDARHVGRSHASACRSGDFGKDQRRRAGAARRTDDRVLRADRPRRRAARRHARRHRPQDGQAQRPGEAVGRRPDARRHALPAARSTPPRPARCSAGPTPRCAAEYTFFRPTFTRVVAAVRRRRVAAGSATTSPPSSPASRPACSRLIPEPPTYQHYVSCWFCEPDGLGTAGPWAEWERKRPRPVAGPVGARAARRRRPIRGQRRTPMTEQLTLLAGRRAHRRRRAAAARPGGPRAHPRRHAPRRCSSRPAPGPARRRRSSGASSRSSTRACRSSAIAAITFTEKAAAELRHRLRERLAEPATDERRAGAALDALDHAPIGTLHAFARRHPVRVPRRGRPAARASPCSTSWRASSPSTSAGRTSSTSCSTTPTARSRPGLPAAELVQLVQLGARSAARAGLRRVDRGLPGQLGPRRPPRRPRAAAASRPVRPTSLDAARRARRHARRRPTTRQADVLAAIVAGRRRAIARDGDLGTMLAGLDEHQEAHRQGAPQRATRRTGRRHGGAEALDALRGRGGRRWPTLVDEHLSRVAASTAGSSSAPSPGASCSTAPRERAAAGTLEFHDLLVLARRLLADRRRRPPAPARALPPGAARRVPGHRPDPAGDRRAAHRRRPTGSRPTPATLRPRARPAVRRRRPEAVDLPLPAGRHRRLPRRRRPDRRRARGAVGQLPLHRRRHRLGQRRVRRRHPARAGRAAGVRPARRLPARAAATTARCTCSAPTSTTTTTSTPRSCASARPQSVAAAVATALREGWPVGDGDGGLRPCRPGDIAVLLPARTSLPMLEPALAAPRRALPGREQLRRLRRPGDPRPHAGAAGRRRPDRRAGPRRRPALAAVRLQRRRAATTGARAAGAGARTPRRPTALADHPVGRGHRPRRARSPATSAGRRRPSCSTASSRSGACSRPRWPAPTPATCGGGCATSSTRPGRGPTPAGAACGATCAGPRYQAAEGRASDTILPEQRPRRRAGDDRARGQGPGVPDHDRQRADHRGPAARRRCRSSGPAGTWALAEKDSALFEAFKPLDEQMGDAERRRLLYVACTRAVDHLVVSLHRKPRERPPRARPRPPAPPCSPTGGAIGHGAATLDRRGRAARRRRRRRRSSCRGPTPWPGTPSGPGPSAAASVRSTTSATRLAVALGDHDADAGDRPAAGRRPTTPSRPTPAWPRTPSTSTCRRGSGAATARRSGAPSTPCSRTPTCATGDDIDRLAAAQCAAEGIFGLEDRGRRPVPLGARRADRRRRRRRRRALAGAVRRRRARRARCSRATSTCSCARRPAWSSSTTRPTSGGRAPTRPPASPATATSWRPTAWPSGACSTSRSPAACSCAAGPTARPRRSSSSGGPRPLAEVAASGAARSVVTDVAVGCGVAARTSRGSRGRAARPSRRPCRGR